MKNIPMDWLGASVALPLVYGILRKLFPIDSSTEAVELSAQEIQKYQSWLSSSVLIWLLVLTPLLTWALCVLSTRLGHEHVLESRGFDLAVTPHWLYWSFVCVFAAMVCGGVAIDLFFRIVMRRDYEGFVRYQELEMGFKAESQWVLLPIFVALCLVGATLLANWYCALDNKGIAINRFFGGETRYDFDEVQEIHTAPSYTIEDGRVVNCRLYKIVLRSGDPLWTLGGPMIPRRSEWKEFAEEVSQRSGIAMTELEILVQ